MEVVYSFFCTISRMFGDDGSSLFWAVLPMFANSLIEGSFFESRGGGGDIWLRVCWNNV